MRQKDFRLCEFFTKLVFYCRRKTFSLHRFVKQKIKNLRNLKLAVT